MQLMSRRLTPQSSALAIAEMEVKRLNALDPWVFDMPVPDLAKRGGWNLGRGANGVQVRGAKVLYYIGMN